MPYPTEQQIYEAIQLRGLDHWFETHPGGFRTVRTAPLLPTLLAMSMVLLILFIMYGRVTRRGHDAPDWFWWAAAFILVGVVAAICFSQFRNVIFDVAERNVSVTILGMTSFQRSFSDFVRFSFDPGYVVNGIDPGGVLYMNFKDESRLRLVQLRDPDELREIQVLVLQMMAPTT